MSQTGVPGYEITPFPTYHWEWAEYYSFLLCSNALQFPRAISWPKHLQGKMRSCSSEKSYLQTELASSRSCTFTSAVLGDTGNPTGSLLLTVNLKASSNDLILTATKMLTMI